MSAELSLQERLRRELARNPRTRCTVITDSMEPLIAKGSEIEVASPAPPFARYDIVLYWMAAGESLVCHYIWHLNTLPSARGERTYVARPLNPRLGREEDPPIDESLILGRVVSHRIPAATRVRLELRALFRRFLG